MPARGALFRLLLLAAIGTNRSTWAYQQQPPSPQPLRSQAPPPSTARRSAGDVSTNRGGFLWRLGGGAAAAAAAAASLATATALPRAAQALVDVGLRKTYVDSNEFFSIEYPVGWYLSRRPDPASASNPAFMEKPSATLLVVADYGTGATASITRASLPILVREGMGYGKIMDQFGGLGAIEKFEDVLDGKGVAALLMRDRDGQLKVSALAPPRPGAMLEGDKGEAQANSGFLSKLVACKPDGKVMDFTVNTPVNRIPTVSPDQQRSRGGRPIRQASDVISGLQDASPIETAPSTLVRQQADVRVSKARSFLRDDGTILTVWVSADRSAWADPDASASLSAILASFQP